MINIDMNVIHVKVILYKNTLVNEQVKMISDVNSYLTHFIEY